MAAGLRVCRTCRRLLPAGVTTCPSCGPAAGKPQRLGPVAVGASRDLPLAPFAAGMLVVALVAGYLVFHAGGLALRPSASDVIAAQGTAAATAAPDTSGVTAAMVSEAPEQNPTTLASQPSTAPLPPAAGAARGNGASSAQPGSTSGTQPGAAGPTGQTAAQPNTAGASSAVGAASGLGAGVSGPAGAAGAQPATAGGSVPPGTQPGNAVAPDGASTGGGANAAAAPAPVASAAGASSGAQSAAGALRAAGSVGVGAPVASAGAPAGASSSPAQPGAQPAAAQAANTASSPAQPTAPAPAQVADGQPLAPANAGIAAAAEPLPSQGELRQAIKLGQPLKLGGTNDTLVLLATNQSAQPLGFTARVEVWVRGTIAATAAGGLPALVPGQTRVATLKADRPLPTQFDRANLFVDSIATPPPGAADSPIRLDAPRLTSTSPPAAEVAATNAADAARGFTVQAAFAKGDRLVALVSAPVTSLPPGQTRTVALTATSAADAPDAVYTSVERVGD